MAKLNFGGILSETLLQMDPAILVACPHCGSSLSVSLFNDLSKSQRVLRCAACGDLFASWSNELLESMAMLGISEKE